jgi:RNA polymerase sigma factor (sigma-70 family)
VARAGVGTIAASQSGERAREFLEATLPHLDAVYRVARHMTRDGYAAEDLVQETYLRAYRSFPGHEAKSTRAWLATICVNLARSEHRRRARRPVETTLPDSDEGPVSPLSVDEEAISRLDREAVSRALARLPGEQRVAVVLMDLAGLSASEVAGALGWPRGTVLSRAYRGRQRLAGLLVEEGSRS